MKRLLVASIVLVMAAPTFAQCQTQTQSQTRTTDPDATITENQKGGPASKESVPNPGGQQTVVKPATPNARTAPAPPPPR